MLCYIKQLKYCAIILAAGKGSRLGADVPKPLAKIKGKPIIQYIVHSFLNFKNIQIGIVINNNSPIINSIKSKCTFIFQNKAKGTGHAVKCCLEFIKQFDYTFISVGDSPLISYQSLYKMFINHINSDIDCSFLTADFPAKYPYASIIRNKKGDIIKCVEQGDAGQSERNVKEKLSSHYLIRSKLIIEYIDLIKVNKNTKEEYFTDIINILIKENKIIEGYKLKDYKELIGINTHLDMIEIKNSMNND